MGQDAGAAGCKEHPGYGKVESERGVTDAMDKDSEKTQLERSVCAVICRGDGVKAREIAKELGVDHQTVNRILYSSPLMKELCWQDRAYRWHGIVRQGRPHAGLQEFSGYYGTVREFTALRRRRGWRN